MKNISDDESLKKEQRQISLPYCDARPSEVTDIYGVHAKTKMGKYPKATQRSGKWLVFVDVKNIDAAWA